MGEVDWAGYARVLAVGCGLGCVATACDGEIVASSPQSAGGALQGGTGSGSSGTQSNAGGGGVGNSAGSLGQGAACEEPSPAARFTFETFQQIVGKRSFAFDSAGSLVTVDEAGDLLRVSRAGESEVWVPALTTSYGAWDMHLLPNGELVLTDATGTLLRVTPEGATDAILAGLGNPSRLAVDGSATVYLSEESAGRVREVDLRTGNSVVIAADLPAPGAMALSPDSSILYVASRTAGIVFGLERDAEGHWSSPREVARTPYAQGNPVFDSCVDKDAGESCDDYRFGYQCAATAQGLACHPPDPCQQHAEGDSCTTLEGIVGECQDLGHGLNCGPIDACESADAGDRCVDGTGAVGVCAEDPWRGGLYCGIGGPCFEGVVGDPCTLLVWGTPTEGVCIEFGGGRLDCSTDVAGCIGLAAGDRCSDSFGFAGTCVELDESSGFLECQQNPPPCEGAVEGDACVTEFGDAGNCEFDFGYPQCVVPPPCEGLSEGDACEPLDGSDVGVCRDYGGLDPYCEPMDPCYGQSSGDACLLDGRLPGVCVDYGGGPSAIYCEDLPPCEGRELGDECSESFSGALGICAEDADGEVYCRMPSACDDLSAGDPCVDSSISGVCADRGDGELSCRPPQPCDGRSESDSCQIRSFSYLTGSDVLLDGHCVAGAVGCTDTCNYPSDGECDDGGSGWVTSLCEFGTDCSDCGPRTIAADGSAGGASGAGSSEELACVVDPPCANQLPGDACYSNQFGTGVCALAGTYVDGAGGATSWPGAGASPGTGTGAGASTGAGTGTGTGAGASTGAGTGTGTGAGASTGAGTGTGAGASTGAGTGTGTLSCYPSDGCESLDVGAPCTFQYGMAGRCSDAWGTGVLSCAEDDRVSGRLGALTVDSCGFLYVVEDEWAYIWRIAPDGSEVARVIELPPEALSGAAWGSGLGNWDAGSLYLIAEDRRTLYAVPILPDDPLQAGPGSE